MVARVMPISPSHPIRMQDIQNPLGIGRKWFSLRQQRMERVMTDLNVLDEVEGVETELQYLIPTSRINRRFWAPGECARLCAA